MNEISRGLTELWNKVPPQLQAVILFALAGGLDGVASASVTNAAQISKNLGFNAAIPELVKGYIIFAPMLVAFGAAAFKAAELGNASVIVNTLAFTLVAIGGAAALDGTIKNWDVGTWTLGAVALGMVVAFAVRVASLSQK